MPIRLTFAVLSASALVLTAPAALAYDGLQQDFATCTQGDSNTQAEAMVGACSRLIENSSAETELVGMFYALRASVNTDKASNCADSRKAVSLIKDQNLLKSAKEMEKAAC